MLATGRGSEVQNGRNVAGVGRAGRQIGPNGSMGQQATGGHKAIRLPQGQLVTSREARLRDADVAVSFASECLEQFGKQSNQFLL